MPRPDADIEECRASHERLHATVRALDDDAMRQASALPGWTVGHVVTHLTRNADSVVRRLDAVIEGRVVEQYEGGAAGRVAEIEAGAHRSAQEMFADLQRADEAVEALFKVVPAEVWERPFAAQNSMAEFQGRPASFLPFTRWREVEIHHVDLGLGYGYAQWPASLVERWLPGLLEGLPARADPRHLLAWTLGRSTAPELRPWG
jgi:maleylpyruvate isomerase